MIDCFLIVIPYLLIIQGYRTLKENEFLDKAPNLFETRSNQHSEHPQTLTMR